MTTTITVNAHCDPLTTEVVMRISETINGECKHYPDKTLQDGETGEEVIYDGKVITLMEVPKNPERAKSKADPKPKAKKKTKVKQKVKEKRKVK